MTPLELQFQNVDFRYRRDREVFLGLDLHFRQGEFTAVIGPNGSGKSTLLRLGCGMLRPDAGHILLGDRDMRMISSRERACRLAVTFQLAGRTLSGKVRDLVMLGRISRRLWWQGFTVQDREAADRAMDKMQILDRAETPYGELSGGEQQRVLLAAALAQEPELLLLDEPTSALDFGHKYELLALLRKLAATGNTGIIMISHDLDLAARFADRIILLHHGRIAADGAPDEVITPENISACYGFPAAVIRGPAGEPIVTGR